MLIVFYLTRCHFFYFVSINAFVFEDGVKRSTMSCLRYFTGKHVYLFQIYLKQHNKEFLRCVSGLVCMCVTELVRDFQLKKDVTRMHKIPFIKALKGPFEHS